MHQHTIQINQPTRYNSFTSLLLDVYVWLNMFRASLRPSSGAYRCTRSLWFYRWSVVVGALLVVVWLSLSFCRSVIISYTDCLIAGAHCLVHIRGINEFLSFRKHVMIVFLCLQMTDLASVDVMCFQVGVKFLVILGSNMFTGTCCCVM